MERSSCDVETLHFHYTIKNISAEAGYQSKLNIQIQNYNVINTPSNKNLEFNLDTVECNGVQSNIIRKKSFPR